MAGIKVGLAFERTSMEPIDETFTLSKAQMLAINDSFMPDKYFAVCKDDGKFYLYDKQATPNAETGKFTLQQGGGTYDDTAVQSSITTINHALANMYTKSETDAKIIDELDKFDHLDYKVADDVPTATTVTIAGVEVPVVEGTRYLVKDTDEDRFYEYVVLGGTVYNLGAASSSAVSAVLSSAITVSNPIGKFAKDEEITSGTALEAILRKMLAQTYYPTLTGPSANLAFASMPALAKVGQQITGGTATATLNRGSIDPQYTSENAFRSGEATNYAIQLKNADAPYSDNNTTGSFTVPDFTKNNTGTVELEITIDYAAGVQPKDSDGGDFGTPLAAGSVTKKISTEFILPFYWGASASATVTDFTGLNEDLTKKGNKEYRITTAVSHPVIAFNSAYGDLTSILDQNGFETIGGWTKSNLTVDGQSYSVYVHNNATTDTNAKYTFKF